MNIPDEHRKTIRAALATVQAFLPGVMDIAGDDIDAALAYINGLEQGQGAGVDAPDWSQAPEWAMYHTIDRDGKRTWWEKKPVLDDKYTWWLYDWSVPGVHYRHVTYKPEQHGIDWRDTLQQRPAPAALQHTGAEA